MKEGQALEGFRLDQLDAARAYCQEAVQSLPPSLRQLSRATPSPDLEVRLSDTLKAYDAQITKQTGG